MISFGADSIRRMLMPKVLKISLLEQILGKTQTEELLKKAGSLTETAGRTITADTVQATKRYLEWLATHGQKPASYTPKQRRQDRIAWQRVAERMLMSNAPAQRLMATYLKAGTTTANTDVAIPCPKCGVPQLVHGLDIHLSRTHGIRGPHYGKGKKSSGAQSR